MEITIYSTTTCTFCHALAGWLDKQGIQYTKKNTDDDDATLLEFMSVNDGLFSVPFTVITDANGKQTKISGFDQRAFKTTLNI